LLQDQQTRRNAAGFARQYLQRRRLKMTLALQSMARCAAKQRKRKGILLKIRAH